MNWESEGDLVTLDRSHASARVGRNLFPRIQDAALWRVIGEH